MDVTDHVPAAIIVQNLTVLARGSPLGFFLFMIK